LVPGIKQLTKCAVGTMNKLTKPANEVCLVAPEGLKYDQLANGLYPFGAYVVGQVGAYGRHVLPIVKRLIRTQVHKATIQVLGRLVELVPLLRYATLRGNIRSV